MKYFFLFSPLFHEWPLAFARRLSKGQPSTEVIGLVSGKERVCRRVESHQNPSIFPLYRLYALEKEWLRVPYSKEKLAKYEQIFGPDVMNRLAIASRQLGYGWVTGATIAETPLMQMARDTEIIRRYVVGLLDFVFGIFEERRPDLVFCYVVAEAPAYCMSKVSKHFGVPFRRFTATRIGNQYIIDDIPEGLLGPVSRTYKNALNDSKDLMPFLPEAKKYLKQFRSAPAKPEFQVASDRREQKSGPSLRYRGNWQDSC